MSQFRTIIETSLLKSINNWLDPYGDRKSNKLLKQKLKDLDKKYAIYVGKTAENKKEYAFKNKDGNWDKTTYLDKTNPFEEIDPTDKIVKYWNTPKEAEKAMIEYKNSFPNENPKIVEVYSNWEDYFEPDHFETDY